MSRKDFGGEAARENVWKQDQQQGRGAEQPHGFDRSQLKNADFAEYYKAQGVVPEGEWDAFLDALRSPLPTTFRVNGSGKFATELRQKLESDFFANFSQGPIYLDGELVKPPRPLPWYPNNLAWQMDFSRGQLRRLSWLGNIHEFMKRATEAGAISRQEAVSMVPPLFMDVRPHHRVLDMCAAPGSKTFQLLEMLHDGSSHGEAPAGIVVANDAEPQRCNLLTHQTKRMCSPCLMVTNHDGQMFPRIFDRAATAADAAAEGEELEEDDGAAAAAAAGEAGEAGEGEGGRKARSKVPRLQFDRILADVPCSGDGTMRKSPDIWTRWGVHGGNGLHPTQLRIALQGARLLKVGGLMVYSTCTFNPVEDEAVVAELMMLCKGALRLVDVSGLMPQLKRIPGLRRWKVRDKYQWYGSWEEAAIAGHKLMPSMFCTNEKAALPLERCMRFLPHHNDTGGFFVAVLEKVAPTGPIACPESANTLRAVALAGRQLGEAEAAGEIRALAAAAAKYALEAAARSVAAIASSDMEAAKKAVDSCAAAVGRVSNLQEIGMANHSAAASAAAAASRGGRGGGRGAARGGRGGRGAARGRGGSGGGGEGSEAMAVDGEKGPEEEGPGGGGGGAGEGPPAVAEMEGVVEEGEGQQQQEQEQEDEEEGAEEGGEGGVGGGDGGKEKDQQQRAAPQLPPGCFPSAAGGGAYWKPSWVRGSSAKAREEAGAERRGRKNNYYKGIDPVYPVQDPFISQMLVEFYGVEPAFPLATHLITRCLDNELPKRLYYVSDGLLKFLLADDQECLKVTSTGLKVFERTELKDKDKEAARRMAGGGEGQRLCPYRPVQEGLPFLLPHLTKQVLSLSAPDFRLLLTLRNLALLTPAGGGEQQQQQQQHQGLSEEGKSALSRIAIGGCVARLAASDAAALGLAGGVGALAANAPLAICAWRTRASLSVLVTKGECDDMLEKMDAAEGKGKANGQQQQQEEGAAAEGGAAAAEETAEVVEREPALALA